DGAQVFILVTTDGPVTNPSLTVGGRAAPLQSSAAGALHFRFIVDLGIDATGDAQVVFAASDALGRPVSADPAGRLRLARATGGAPDGGAPPGSVITQHNDLARTGVNLAETTLNPTTVASAQFGPLFTRAVDGQIYAQPLALAGVRDADGG